MTSPWCVSERRNSNIALTLWFNGEDEVGVYRLTPEQLGTGPADMAGVQIHHFLAQSIPAFSRRTEDIVEVQISCTRLLCNGLDDTIHAIGPVARCTRFTVEDRHPHLFLKTCGIEVAQSGNASEDHDLLSLPNKVFQGHAKGFQMIMKTTSATRMLTVVTMVAEKAITPASSGAVTYLMVEGSQEADHWHGMARTGCARRRAIHSLCFMALRS
jgi:hypothetical protein